MSNEVQNKESKIEENIKEEKAMANQDKKEEIKAEEKDNDNHAQTDDAESAQKKSANDTGEAKPKKREPSDKDKSSEAEKTSDKEENTDTGLAKEPADVDIIDINKEEDKKSTKNDKKAREVGGKNAPRTTNDFIAKQKKRKRTRRIIVILIVLLVIAAFALWIRNAVNKTKEAFMGLQANSVQTSFVEKKTLYDSKDATGTLYALESRTLTTNLGTIVAKIDSVNVEVGDHVEEGDILVEFSKEEVDKSIAEQKEDIYTQRQQDAIDAADAQRNYVYSYTSVANNIQDAAERVDRALRSLHEACNAYGDAKRDRQKAIDDGTYEDQKAAIEQRLASAFQNQEQAQQNYDDAVEAQARTINDSQTGNGSLSSADSSYKKSQLNAGQQVKQLERKLENLEDSLDDYIVTASISGVVTEVNVSEGNKFSNGNVLTIQDDSGFKADVLVDEYDIPKVKKAYNEKKRAGKELEVVVRTDATGDQEYKGHVTGIAPTSTTTTAIATVVASSGGTSAAVTGTVSTANYKVSIELDEIDEAFMIGMSAKVAIVVDESPANSLCVPYNCVEERDGKYYVRVMDENGDKSTMDGIMPEGMDEGTLGKAGEEHDADTKGVNGIVIEKDDSNLNINSKDGRKKKGIFANTPGGKQGEQLELGRRYREEEVEKIFDTDFYAAVVPKKAGSIKEGDEVMIVTEKSSGNDLMSMFGPVGNY